MIEDKNKPLLQFCIMYAVNKEGPMSKERLDRVMLDAVKSIAQFKEITSYDILNACAVMVKNGLIEPLIDS